MKRHLLEIHRNAEGQTLAFAGVVGDGSGYRIAGPKAWGGSRELARIEIRGEDLLRYVREYAPDVVAELASTTQKSQGAELDEITAERSQLLQLLYESRHCRQAAPHDFTDLLERVDEALRDYKPEACHEH